MTDPAPDNWGPCPPGEFDRLAATLALRRWVRTAAAGGILLAAVGGAVWCTQWMLGNGSQPSAPCQTAPAGECKVPPPPDMPGTPAPGTPVSR